MRDDNMQQKQEQEERQQMEADHEFSEWREKYEKETFETKDEQYAYAEYIENQTTICNGDMLINAMEGGKYYEGFLESRFEEIK